MGVWTSCGISEQRRKAQFTALLLHISVSGEEHSRLSKSVLPLSLPRHFPSEEIPLNLLDSSTSNRSCSHRHELYNNLPM